MKLSRITAHASIGVFAALCWGPAGAAQGQVPPPLPASALSLGGALQMFFALAVVLATVAGAAWLLKRLAPGQISAGGALKLIGAIAVGPKERVVVVEIGETWLVLGVAPGQVAALHHLPKLPGAMASQAGGIADRRFSAWLNEIMNRRGESSAK